MTLTRRQTLRYGVTAMTSVGLTTLMPFTARAQDKMDMMDGHSYEAEGGTIDIHPVSHASFALTVPGMVIYADPVGDVAAYEGLPAPDLILITHEHGDHYNADTLAGLVGENTQLVTNPAVFGMLSEEMKAKAAQLANGESTTIGDLTIDAIPAYNITADRMQYHPEGRDNGYVLSVAGKRVYIAGDTEDIPEMRALQNIDIAFLPMNLPYTMDVTQAADAVGDFAPTFVYPYHYRGSDTEQFASLVGDEGVETEVVLHDWYAGA